MKAIQNEFFFFFLFLSSRCSCYDVFVSSFFLSLCLLKKANFHFLFFSQVKALPFVKTEQSQTQRNCPASNAIKTLFHSSSPSIFSFRDFPFIYSCSLNVLARFDVDIFLGTQLINKLTTKTNHNIGNVVFFFTVVNLFVLLILFFASFFFFIIRRYYYLRKIVQ